MVDTLASGASGGNPVEVQVLSQAPVTSSGPTTGRRSGPHNPGYRGLSCLRPAPLDPANTARPQDTHRRPSCAAHSNARLKVGAATREQPPGARTNRHGHVFPVDSSATPGSAGLTAPLRGRFGRLFYAYQYGPRNTERQWPAHQAQTQCTIGLATNPDRTHSFRVDRTRTGLAIDAY